MGLTVVHKHYETNSAQQVWLEFTTYMKSSMKAEHTANKLLAWLTTSKYDSNWRGTSQGYVLYWLKHIQEYDLYFENEDDKFTPKHKLKMLCHDHVR
jgi:hypothetical protein